MNIKSFPMADVQVIQSLKNIKVFEVCECDAVAAESKEEAINWYMEQTGLDREDLYSNDVIVEVSEHLEVWEDEDMKEKISVADIVRKYWFDGPFIVYSRD
jgi:hypothetical protein